MIISIPAAVCMAFYVEHCIATKCQQQLNDFQTMNLPVSKNKQKINTNILTTPLRKLKCVLLVKNDIE